MFKGNVSLAVGIFFSVALAGVAGFSMWLAGTKGNQPMVHYSMLFEDDVSGLSLGGPVYYLGVNVGQVSAMELIPGDHVKVRVDINILETTPVDSGSWASLNAQGITGVTVINISGQPGDHSPIKQTEGFKYPLIPIRQTGLSALLAGAPKTVEKLNHLLDQVNELMGPQNRETVTQILQQFESLTAELSDQRETIGELPAELKSLLMDARTMVGEVQTVIRTVEPGLADTMTGINSAAANLDALTLRVDTLVAENSVELEHFIDNGLGQVPDLIIDLRTTLRDLQKLLVQLQADPSQLILRSPDDVLEVKP